jgi:hypothetical protein
MGDNGFVTGNALGAKGMNFAYGTGVTVVVADAV